MPTVHELLNLSLRDVLDIRFARIQHVDLAGVSIESGDFMSRLGEAQRERQPHVTTSDNAYLKLSALEEFRFPVNWHESRRTPSVGIQSAAEPIAKGHINIAGFI